jgi:hypothetical protein
MKKFKEYLTIIGATVAAIFAAVFAYKKLTSSSPLPEKAPNDAERKKAEAELAQVEKEIDELNNKHYSDDEIKNKLGQ